MNMVKKKQNKLPLPSQEHKAKPKTQAKKSGVKTNRSQTPSLDEAFWDQAIHNPFFKPIKTQTSVRIDSDILAWLKSQGKGYQTRINSILRKAMLHSLSHKN